MANREFNDAFEQVQQENSGQIYKKSAIQSIPNNEKYIADKLLEISNANKYVSLRNYSVYMEDDSINSKYFKVSEFPDILTAGKNFFLLDGSEYLQPFSDIKFEVIDSKGFVIYSEVANTLINETSRMINIYAYDGLTNIGAATVVLLGVLADVPDVWKYTYNVRWQRTVTVNTLIGDAKQAILIDTPEVDISEIYDEQKSLSKIKIKSVYGISS